MLFVVICPQNALAYIGPGAGFALVSSLFTLFISFILAFFSFLTLPVRMVINLLKNRKAFARAKYKRIIILGLDGLDPDLCDKFIKEGKLPNLEHLKNTGTYNRLRTTYPPLSPVAWSTFSTGVNPGKHNIFDFLKRNPKTYFPELSSSKIEPPKRRLNIGKFRIPIGKPVISFMRKSKSFWKILGENGIRSHILRVPITFPPEKFNGTMLSAMCTPDLRGTQGSFTFYSTRSAADSKYTGGTRLSLQGNKTGVLSANLPGPDNPIKKSSEPLKIDFTLKIESEKNQAVLKIQKDEIILTLNEFSPWIKIKFKAFPGIKIRGMCQFYLKTVSPEVELYVSPINIDPEQPSLPISHPIYFSVYLAKLFGSFNTLGLSEDTWALNEEVLDEEAFLKQAYSIHADREKHYFKMLDKTKRGVLAGVFDATDRIQHMFFRYLVDNHPANQDKDVDKYRNVIEALYQKADKLVGKVVESISDDTFFIVMSDHGFKPFIRGVNINSWFHENGYLTLKNSDFTVDYFLNVDWEKTRAYAFGLGGIYLNIKNRESSGIVKQGEEADSLKREIIKKLSGLNDPEFNKTAITNVYDSSKIYSGPYLKNGPDLIAGFNEGYRVSWDCAIGKTSENVFEDNTKAWSGDHCIDPVIVPGVLFSNHRIEEDKPGIEDIAPTILELLGISTPSYMDGKALRVELP